jgi:hypothetical protein
MAGRFGVHYQDVLVRGETAPPDREAHPLVEQVPILAWVAGNARGFTMGEAGLVLAQANGQIIVGVVPYGEAGGEVVVLADVGLLGGTGETGNRVFWQNLARYAQTRD